MTERLNELLEKLKKLDPDTYQVLREWHVFDPNELDRYIIAGAIQDAIANPERKWTLIIEYPVKDSEWWGAEITDRATGASRIRIGPTLAEAILEAYVALLEALEVQQG